MVLQGGVRRKIGENEQVCTDGAMMRDRWGTYREVSGRRVRRVYSQGVVELGFSLLEGRQEEEERTVWRRKKRQRGRVSSERVVGVVG